MTDEADSLGMTSDNWMFIYANLHKDRTVSYRVRGMGENYTLLGRFLSLMPCTDEWDDWPWYGWKFAVPENEARFREIYGPLIHLDPMPDSAFASFEDMENPEVAPAQA